MAWADFNAEEVPNEVINYMLDLIDRINYAYLKTDGTYGNLAYVVSDKVKLIEKTLWNRKEELSANKFKIHEAPKPRRATNRELSKWLAQGNGECLGTDNCIYTHHDEFLEEECDDTCFYGAQVRKWEDSEWHEPTVDYMGLEE